MAHDYNSQLPKSVHITGPGRIGKEMDINFYELVDDGDGFGVEVQSIQGQR